MVIKSEGRLIAITPKNLLFIVPTGHLDAASLKRVYDLLPFFQAAGYQTAVVSYRWEWLWRTRLQADLGNRASAGLLRVLNATRLMPLLYRVRDRLAFNRLARLIQQSDAVIVLRTALDERWRQSLQAQGRFFIYEFDDAVWLSDEDGYKEMMKLADAVVVGNQYLAEAARTQHPQVTVIPTGVRLDRYEQAARTPSSSTDQLVIGWVGSPTTTRYLDLLVEPLAKLGEEVAVVFRIVGSGKAELPRFQNIEIDLHPQIPYDPLDFVPGFDVGVMPLTNTKWERGKCGAKALEYMAAGVATVCSDVGENRRIIQDGENGVLARSSDDWLAALRTLARDIELRNRIGQAGRERIRTAYATERIVALWQPVLAAQFTFSKAKANESQA